jgi:predicted NBD/HSP70 family sugar kinase
MTKKKSNGSGVDHGLMRELNRSLVLDVIKARSPISRPDIAKTTQLTKPTVSGIVNDLMKRGLVRRVGMGATTTGGGRPPLLLEFNKRSEFLVGVQIGVERSTVVVADALGTEIGRTSVDNPKGEPAAALKSLAKTAMTLVEESGASKRRVSAAGICLPGLVEMRTGKCLLAPNLGWKDVPVADVFSEAFGVPTFVVNNADAAVVVESTEGAAKGARNVVLLHVGSGVGAGILSDGKLLHGAEGFAGEIGHCHIPGLTRQCNCGRTGCLETETDGAAIARAAQEKGLTGTRGGQLTAEDVARAAAEGDPVAQDVLASAGRVLGVAASWLINLFDPEILLVGGGVAAAGPSFLEPLKQQALAMTLPHLAERVEVRPWAEGIDAVVRGAILVAMQKSESYFRVIFQE